VKIAHVGFDELTGKVFLSCNVHEGCVEIQAIHGEALGSEMARVLAGTTSDI
jgi:hypothetical protein